MLIDLNETCDRRFDCDICVVGTGAAGLTLASVLMRSGASVIMLESGGSGPEPDGDRLNVCETDRKLLFAGARRGRRRGLGGSTACWGGQLLPLEPIDFARRDWVDHSGWPITEAEMAPYYRLALQFAGSDERNFDSDVCRALGRDSPFDPQVLRYFFSKWSPHPRFRDLLVDDLRESTDVRVFLHATVTRIELGNGGERVREVRAANTALEEFVFTAGTVVLCTGGIETPRLLLANRHQAPQGIGNEHDLVGRFFQDHPNVRVGTIRSGRAQWMRDLFSSATVDGVHMTPQLSLAPEVQAAEGLLNASAHVWFGYPRSLLQRLPVLNLARRIGVEPHAARNLIDASLLLSAATVRLHRQGARLGEGRRFAITVIVEQEPCPESRITLAGRTDRFGVPRAKIRWHLTDKTWGTVVRVARVLETQFQEVGLGTLDLFPQIATNPVYWNVFPHDAYHHMGATRMASSPEAGVVDENCRVFGVENLFVASSSVFPTGGHSNCTLTIMALALRLAEHLGVSRDSPGTALSVGDAR